MKGASSNWARMHELMEQNGLYARLYSMQFRNPEEELAALLAKARAEGRWRKACPKNPAGCWICCEAGGRRARLRWCIRSRETRTRQIIRPPGSS